MMCTVNGDHSWMPVGKAPARGRQAGVCRCCGQVELLPTEAEVFSYMRLYLTTVGDMVLQYSRQHRAPREWPFSFEFPEILLPPGRP